MAVARVLGAKGLRGALRIEPLTDRPERLAIGESIWIEGERLPRGITEVGWGGRVPVLQLEGIDDRAAAERLAGRYLEAEATPLPEGSYYWHQLIGLAVADDAGMEIGTVVEVFRAGENEVYRIEGPSGELLVPALRDVVRSIDLAAGRMVVHYEAEEV
ncbi:MAG TPA: ribosome maturation factor RimM [Candidatus Limnocylindria bacterium]|nr:ribosome maturation factor RimM [Candidatus Limnocylindria bacterium]